MRKPILPLVASLLTLFLAAGCKEKEKTTNAPARNTPARVTFIELGSVNCVPCRMMVPVMEKVVENFGKDVVVLFYDVWTPQGRPVGQAYGIRAIPTQVFLDEKGKEFFRHEGFLPYEQIVGLLETRGIK